MRMDLLLVLLIRSRRRRRRSVIHLCRRHPSRLRARRNRKRLRRLNINIVVRRPFSNARVRLNRCGMDRPATRCAMARQVIKCDTAHPRNLVPPISILLRQGKAEDLMRASRVKETLNLL